MTKNITDIDVTFAVYCDMKSCDNGTEKQEDEIIYDLKEENNCCQEREISHHQHHYYHYYQNQIIQNKNEKKREKDKPWMIRFISYEKVCESDDLDELNISGLDTASTGILIDYNFSEDNDHDKNEKSLSFHHAMMITQ